MKKITTKKNGNKKIAISAPHIAQKVQKGDSISNDGVCLTATNIIKNFIEFDLCPETLNRTTLKDLKQKQKIHLDLPLTNEQFIGGHCILGHIDFVASVKKISSFKNTKQKKIFLSFPKKFKHLIPVRGSIAINGVSLTITKKKKQAFAISLIPETLKQTLLNNLKQKDKVNVEVDFNSRIIQCNEDILSIALNLKKQDKNSWEKTLNQGGIIGIEKDNHFFLAIDCSKLNKKNFAFLWIISHNLPQIYLNKSFSSCPSFSNKEELLKYLKKIPHNNNQRPLCSFKLYDSKGKLTRKNQFISLCERFLIPKTKNF